MVEGKTPTVCILNSNKYIDWNRILVKGAQRHGFNVHVVMRHKDPHLKSCRVLWVVGYKHKNNRFKNDCIRLASNAGAKIIFVDSGAFYDRVNVPVNEGDKERLFSITVDGPKRLGMKFLADCEMRPNRFDDLKDFISTDISDTIRQDGFHTVLLHNIAGFAEDYTTRSQQVQEFRSLCSRLDAAGKRVIYSVHPLSDERSLRDGKTMPLDEIMEKSACCLGWHTNALSWVCLKGMPIVCYDESNFAYPMATQDFNNVFYPSLEQRYEWANTVAQTQYSLEEVIQGEVWENIRPHFEK